MLLNELARLHFDRRDLPAALEINQTLLADMEAAIVSARATMLHAARLKDAGLPLDLFDAPPAEPAAAAGRFCEVAAG